MFVVIAFWVALFGRNALALAHCPPAAQAFQRNKPWKAWHVCGAGSCPDHAAVRRAELGVACSAGMHLLLVGRGFHTRVASHSDVADRGPGNRRSRLEPDHLVWPTRSAAILRRCPWRRSGLACQAPSVPFRNRQPQPLKISARVVRGTICSLAVPSSTRVGVPAQWSAALTSRVFTDLLIRPASTRFQKNTCMIDPFAHVEFREATQASQHFLFVSFQIDNVHF